MQGCENGEILRLMSKFKAKAGREEARRMMGELKELVLVHQRLLSAAVA